MRMRVGSFGLMGVNWESEAGRWWLSPVMNICLAASSGRQGRVRTFVILQTREDFFDFQSIHFSFTHWIVYVLFSLLVLQVCKYEYPFLEKATQGYQISLTLPQALWL